MFPFAYPSPTISAVAPVSIFQDEDYIIATQASFTFTAMAIGSAAANRYVIVGFIGASGNLLASSVTIGGIAATIVVQGIIGGTNTAGMAIAAVPTGTTANVVIVWPSNQVHCGAATWSVTGLNSATPVGALYGWIDDTPPQLNPASTAGGFVTAIGVHPNTAFLSLSGPGTSQDFDVNPTSNVHFAGASGVTAGTSELMTASSSFFNTNAPWAVATWF